MHETESRLNIAAATHAYEEWLRRQATISDEELALKHRRMAADPFGFLRGTYYRWAQLFPAIVPEVADAPLVVCVGDLHIRNFGTWRDAEGRLVWGVNDFDEAYPLPYTCDLVRLAASVLVARRCGLVQLRGSAACNAIFDGYMRGLDLRGRPFVLGERRRWLSRHIERALPPASAFREELRALPDLKEPMPVALFEALGALLPERGTAYTAKRRSAGVGSLGRMRVVALVETDAGVIAREAKQLVPSAAAWAAGHETNDTYAQWLLERAVRARDPLLRASGGWVARRIAPDCRSLEFIPAESKEVERRLFRAMGIEIANIHLASAPHIGTVLDDLHRRGGAWLHPVAKRMARAVVDEWKVWKR